MPPIPYALGYTTSANGKVPKHVLCELCGLDYVDILTVRSEGYGSSA
ncbi:MAG: hypothetical protein JWO38_5839 [Gemmataceae bacterium]|nr:hypothetical protein [Gemmataceae bacterium]